MNNRVLPPVVFAAALAASTLLSLAAAAQVEKIETLAQALNVAQTYHYGDSGAAMEFIRALVLEVQLDPAARNDLANTLAALLHDPESTDAFKLFICKQLYIIGGEDQVDELAPMLSDARYAHIARYALEVMPSPAVNSALWEAIANADGPAAAGLTASLAARGGPEAVSRLSQLLSNEHKDVVTAATIGLGRLGGAEAEVALRKAVAASPEDARVEIYEALLGCAEVYRKAGSAAEAQRLYNELIVTDMPVAVRLAAFHGLVEIGGEQAAPLVATAITSGELPLVTAAMAYVRSAGGPESTALFAQLLAAATPDVQVLLLQALADRGDPVALDTIAGGVNSPDAEVRYATLDALGALGNETSVLALIDALLSDEEEAVRRGRASLIRLADAGVNGALVALYEQAPPEARIELVAVLADRQAVEALPVLLDTATYEEGELRSAAFAAIGRLAGQDDVPDVAPLLYEAEDEAVRTEAARAVTQVFRRTPPSDARAEALRGLYESAPSGLTRGAVLNVFRELGDDRMLPLVLVAVNAGEAVVRDGAITALTGWPNATPIEQVYALARDAAAETYKKQALDGYIRMLRMPSDAPVDTQVAGFKQALALPAGPDATRTILAGLSELKSTAALDLAEGLIGDEALHAEAAMAAERIRSQFYALTASVATETAPQAADGNINTFWRTPGPQEPGQWIEIDLSRPAAIKGVVLDASRTKDGYPRGYSVYVYEHGGLPGEPVAVGEGTEGVTTINFARPVSGQMLRIEQTGAADDTPWVVHEIRVVPA